jgi:twitching motility protein PilI
MEEKKKLRDFQAQLAERLQNAGTQTSSPSKLAFIAGKHHWLTDLSDINEVVTVMSVTSVPWAKPWFVGVANVRGNLYGCTDLAAFLGLTEVMGRGETRLLLVHPRFGVNAALRVEQALGLRKTEELSALPAEPGPEPWVKARWRGPDDVEWTELSMEALVTSPRFLDTGT